ncbi:MAG: NADH-quinone oxidoreductase subunit NuoE [Candidatus Woesearchaeota archaeon]|nr:NADH-quinone oxidoreductase subunit NuoE [Candidatus Woesearchaeota archaeon]
MIAGFSGFERDKSNVIPLLQYVQREIGFLPGNMMGEVADYLRLPKAHIYGVATFYSQFRFKPQGEHVITVCEGTACHVRGRGEIRKKLESILGITAGETTEDRMFSLETVACLGSCALAPTMVVDGRVYGKMNEKKLKKLFEAIKFKQE